MVGNKTLTTISERDVAKKKNTKRSNTLVALFDLHARCRVHLYVVGVCCNGISWRMVDVQGANEGAVVGALVWGVPS